MSDFAYNVLALLRERNWSQADLAARLQRSPQYVSQVLCGYRRATLKTVQAFAEALSVTSDLLQPDEIERDLHHKKHRTQQQVSSFEAGGDERAKDFDRAVALWRLTDSYQANIANEPTLAFPQRPLQPVKSVLLGYDINSPFGVSACPLTATSGRIKFLASTGADVITFNTVRSRSFASLSPPNIFCCVPYHGEPLPSSEDALVVDTADAVSPLNGMMNRFGVPSSSPEVWQCEFETAKRALAPGQLLFLSVVGTPDPADDADSLVSDFARVTRLAAEVQPHAIEVNASCPNSTGIESLLYYDLNVLTRTLRTVKQNASGIPVILKIGVSDDAQLSAVARVSAKYVNAVAAINTVPRNAVLRGQRGDLQPAFGSKRKAGLSGAPIFQIALRVIEQLVAIRHRENYDFEIIGVGGASSPTDVQAYLNAGADATQAATIFFSDAYFALKVRKALLARNVGNEHVAKSRRWSMFTNVIAAADALASDYSTDELLEGSLEVMLRWQANERQAGTSLSRLSIPSVSDVKADIRRAIGGRPSGCSEQRQRLSSSSAQARQPRRSLRH